MKKKSIRVVIIVLSMLCMTGCRAAGREGKHTAEDLTPTLALSDIFQTEETLAAGTPDDSEILGETLEKITDTGLGKYNAANRWMSHVAKQSRTSLFCIDADTGVVYFVNQCQDYYIYRLKDGKAELAVPMPAKELYLWEGVLYFMIDSYDWYELKEMKEGDIYAYTPSEGTVELIYAVGSMTTEKNMEIFADDLQRLTVNENGISFVSGAKTEQKKINDKVYTVLKEAAYVLPFGETEPVTDAEGGTYPGWGEYQFAYVKEEGEGYWVALMPRVDGRFSERIIIGKAFNYFGMGDDVYLMSGKAITKKNLVTNEEMVFDTYPMVYERHSGMLEKHENVFELEFFTVTEDYIWAINSWSELFQFDRKTGEATWYMLALDGLNVIGEEFGMLYTDGHTIYIMTEFGFAQILTEEVTENENGEKVLGGKLLVEE